MTIQREPRPDGGENILIEADTFELCQSAYFDLSEEFIGRQIDARLPTPTHDGKWAMLATVRA